MSKKQTLQQIREAQKLTRQQLADKAGVSVMTIVRAEDRKGWPLNAAIRKAVQTALGVQS